MGCSGEKGGNDDNGGMYSVEHRKAKGKVAINIGVGTITGV